LCKNKFKYYDEEVLKNTDLTCNNELKIQYVIKLIDELQIEYSNCMHEKDKFEIQEKINNKADRFDIIRMDESKSNKTDLNAIALTIDYMHKQFE